MKDTKGPFRAVPQGCFLLIQKNEMQIIVMRLRHANIFHLQVMGI
jgi:hypothetical protein